MHSKNSTATTPEPYDGLTWGERRQRRRELRAKIFDPSVLLGAVAGLLSFIHIRDIAALGGQAGWAAWLYPLIVDTITVSAYAKLKRSQEAGENSALPWSLLIMGVLASLTANVIDALMHAPIGASTPRLVLCIAVGTWPAVAWLGSMLLRHSGKPTAIMLAAMIDRPTAEQPQPTPIVQPVADDQPTGPDPQPIPVKPAALGDLGPRVAVGELPLPVWVEIGRPAYREIKNKSGGRPTEKAMQVALTERVTALIATGKLPATIGQPSGSTAKRIRRAIEDQHPELTARPGKPQQLAIAGG